MPITAEDVLKVVQRLGPVVPNKIKQELEQPDSMLINVYLSELKTDNKIRLTHLQLGSSSFAYTPEQTHKLADLVKHLNEKNRRVADKLAQAGVMRASNEDPLTRVALQTIKDFAKPINVKTHTGNELYYRWFLLPTEEATNKIKEQHKTETPTKQPEPQTTPEKKAEKTPEPKPEAPKPPTKIPSTKQPEIKKKPQEKQQHILDINADTTFAKTIVDYFTQKNIEIHEWEEIRKNSEIDAVIELPTPVGNITYYCKAKSKKRSNDGDLASTILNAKKHMLPAMYLTTGTVTKKAKNAAELREVQVIELGRSA